jgi:hypothetical protein
MRARLFGKTAEGRAADPSHESDENENVPGIIDTSPTEFTDEHIQLRESLVRQFQVRYERGEVHWLAYPGRKKTRMH